MNSQELRALQEAYSQVYELDEGLKSIDTPEKAQKYAYKALGSAARAAFTGDKKTLNKRLTGIKMGQRKAERKAAEEVEEQYDLYDIIFSHLLDEGYAETPEAAEAIMVNMSADWRDAILS
jgi:hypothetical protein